MDSQPTCSRKNTTEQTPEKSDRPNRYLRLCGTVLLNFWLIFHLTGIITAPATVGPSSQTARSIWELVGPYLQVFYLNHGFHFFAPEPGSSNLVAWSATLPDGSVRSGRFPNFDIQPRLYYHRHFMLSEFLGNSDPELQQQLVQAYAGNICRQHNAVSVSLSVVRHNLSAMERVRAGGRLNDPDLYEEQPLGTFQWKSLQNRNGDSGQAQPSQL